MQGMSKLMTRRESNFKQGSGHALDPAGNPVSEWDYLNNFFKRYNKVLPPFPVVTCLTGMWLLGGQTFDGGMFAECVSCAEHAKDLSCQILSIQHGLRCCVHCRTESALEIAKA